MEEAQTKTGKNKKKPSAIPGIVAFFLLSLLAYWLFLEIIVEYDQRFVPAYEKVSLEEILEQGKVSGSDKALDPNKDSELFRELYLQTGLGTDTLEEILALNGDAALRRLQLHQDNFFNPRDILCRKITPITGEEKNADEEGNLVPGFEIQQIRTGDIFLSFSTHSLGWRHGHSALVINGDTGRTLEAVVLGRNSEAQRAEKWPEYPTFLQIRLSDEALDQLGISRREAEERLAEVGEEKLTDVPYGLLTGMFGKYVPEIRETQCSHLVWYAYYELGLDIDSDGGWLVTPRDIAGSPYFEVVQIVGLDPSAAAAESPLQGESEKE